MADFQWISLSSTDAKVGANWESAGSTGTAPTVDGARMIISGIGTANLTNTDFSAYNTQTLVLTQAAAVAISVEAGGIVTPFKMGHHSTIINHLADNSQGSGISLGQVDVGYASTILSYGSNPSPANASYPALEITGGGSDGATFNIYGGALGIAVRSGKSCLIAALKLISGENGTPTVSLGANCTAPTVFAGSGIILSYAAGTFTSITLDGGSMFNKGDAAVTTLNVAAPTSTFTQMGLGTLSAATNNGTLDFSQDTRPKTMTTYTGRRGSTLNLDNGVPGSVTITDPLLWPDGLGDGRAAIKTPSGMQGTMLNS